MSSDMSIILRIFLLIASLFSFIYIARKLKKCEVQIPETVFWIILSVVFIIFSAFPQVADWGAALLGVATPVNFIFLIVIALLLLRVFMLTIRVSKLEYKLNNLVQELAVRKNKEETKQND